MFIVKTQDVFFEDSPVEETRIETEEELKEFLKIIETDQFTDLVEVVSDEDKGRVCSYPEYKVIDGDEDFEDLPF